MFAGKYILQTKYAFLLMSVVAVLSVGFLSFSFLSLVKKQDENLGSFFSGELSKSELMSSLQSKVTRNHKILIDLLLTPKALKSEEYVYEYGVRIIDEAYLIEGGLSEVEDRFMLNNEERLLFSSLRENLQHYRKIIEWSIEITTVDLSDAGRALRAANLYFARTIADFTSMIRVSLIKNEASFSEVRDGAAKDLNAFLPTAMLAVVIIMALSMYMMILSSQQSELVKKYNKQLEIDIENRTRELINANTRLETSSRVKTEFLSRMSHELRTPMNAILGFSQLMKDSDELSETDRLNSEEIYQAGTVLLQMINDMLYFEQVDKDGSDVLFEVIKINSILEACIEKYAAIADKAEVGLHLESAVDACIRVDPRHFTVIVEQLLSNAIKYNKEGGDVLIKSMADGGKVKISVIDSGFGIDADKLESVFEPFFKKDTEKAFVSGTGVGLSLAKLLTLKMNGQLTVSSRPDQGSTFLLEFDRLSC